MKKHSLTYLMLAALMVLGCSCERRPMFDEEPGEVILDLQLILEVENEGMVDCPQTVSANFYHPEEHYIIHNDFTGPTGGRVHLTAGKYDLIVYNFDTYSTHVREEHHSHTIEAYTNNVQASEVVPFEILRRYTEEQRKSRAYLDEPVIYEPDHLFVGKVDNVVIPHGDGTVQHIVIHSEASSIVEVYNLTIGNMIGMDNISKATVYLTGQVGSVQFGTGTVTGEPSTIMFPVNPNGSDKLRGTFRTFGRYPGADCKVYLIIDIIDTGGQRHLWEWDVTDQFESGTHDIEINDEIVVPDNTGGESGFVPTVTPWDNHNTDINI